MKAKTTKRKPLRTLFVALSAPLAMGAPALAPSLAFAQEAPERAAIPAADNAISIAPSATLDWDSIARGNWSNAKSRRLAEAINAAMVADPRFAAHIRMAHYDTGRGRLADIRRSLDAQGLSHIWYDVALREGANNALYDSNDFYGQPGYQCLGIGFDAGERYGSFDRSFYQTAVLLHELGHCLYYARIEAIENDRHIRLSEAFADYFMLAVLQTYLGDDNYFNEQKNKWISDRRRNRHHDPIHYSVPIIRDLEQRYQSGYSGNLTEIFDEAFARFVTHADFIAVHGEYNGETVTQRAGIVGGLVSHTDANADATPKRKTLRRAARAPQ